MTRADRLYRVWLERELGKISTEEAWERVDEIQSAPTPYPLWARRALTDTLHGERKAA